ncbi:MAG TPA: hypothetical protein VJZ75_06515 [Candidatus Bathyarchaeia archaeon]|nr:hypothetical protein [Candidatus Bathyarchaeia archaeon]
MDAKAVANEIYLRHSMSVTEEQVLHAQAWLQDELKLTETQSVTEKKTENTAPATPPVNVPPDGGGRVGAVLAGVETTPASPSKEAEVKLIIPEGMPETPPIPFIDGLIRRGYHNRDDLEAFMKEKFKGKAYRDDVRERLQLFRARQPPFNDIAFTPPVIPPPTPPVTTPPSRHNPENTGISPGTGGVGGGVGGGVAGGVPAASEQPTDLPDVLKAARALTDEQAISSLQTGFLTAFQQPLSRSMMRPINIPQSNFPKC